MAEASDEGTGVGPATAAGHASRAGVWSWILFDWAAQPYFTLVTTFVFAPYFAARLAPDPATGQALWGYSTAAAGLAIALLSPVLGAIADASGRRKPWIAAFSVLLVVASLTLWFTEPGRSGAISIALVAFAVGTIGAEFATVFTNAMMPDLVPEHRLGRLSGTGWAVGYIGGIVSLVIVLGFLSARPETGRTILGLAPLFGLDPATGAGDRAAGPFTAIWYRVLVAPLSLGPRAARPRGRPAAAIRHGLAALKKTIASLPAHRPAAVYLLAHMIYADGLVALFAFGGIYGAGVFGWSMTEIGIFGILLAFTGTIGALLGGRIEDRIGPKAVIIGSLGPLTLAAIGILSIDRTTIGFVVPVDADLAAPDLYATLPERLYLALGGLVGFAAGPLQSSSRTLLARLAPKAEMTSFFGLLALSGKMTSFVGPFMVGALTALSGSQRIGMSVLVAFFVAGAALTATVPIERWNGR